MLKFVMAALAVGMLVAPALAADHEFEVIPLPERETIEMTPLKPIRVVQELPAVPDPDILRVELLRQAFECWSPEDQNEDVVAVQKQQFGTEDAFMCPFKGDESDYRAVEAVVTILNIHHHSPVGLDEPMVACRARDIFQNDNDGEAYAQLCWSGEKGYWVHFTLTYLPMGEEI